MRSKGFCSLGISLFFLFLSIFFVSASSYFDSNEKGHVSVVISEKGLAFIKDLLVQEALSSVTSLRLPKIQKSMKIPFVGGVRAVLSNITISQIDVTSSAIEPGDSGIVIVASGATVNLSMNWYYSYRTWLIPVDISDKGRASIRVEGMEIGLTIGMNIQEGTLKLSLLECGCYVKDMIITLDGGASWFYQGLVDAFEGQIRAAVENAITKKIKEGIIKLDILLQNLPKQIPVDETAAMNVTFVNEPSLLNTYVGLEINGLFTSTDIISPKFYHDYTESSISCNDPLKMLGISLEEAVFNSASVVYFKAGLMHWVVDKDNVPDQSILNTAGWKYIVPQLFKKYPNDEMMLNISLTSPPLVKISLDKIDATISSDMTIDVLENNEVIPVACISVEVRASGFVEVSGNNLAGQAGLDGFTLTLQWSKVGNFHMFLIEKVMHVLLKDVALPFVNSRLRKGFPLPIIHGFMLENADILFSPSRIVVCSDVAYIPSHNRMPLLFTADMWRTG
ncbi:putative BPI/LBP family protein At1g04970 [Aristolochia californica]|uniref:putative BPI/LBP family protein At1g04970 n=1 Tax=Aristolochia californica TaxID=171875 RepID=UPI0035D8D12E